MLRSLSAGYLPISRQGLRFLTDHQLEVRILVFERREQLRIRNDRSLISVDRRRGRKIWMRFRKRMATLTRAMLLRLLLHYIVQHLVYAVARILFYTHLFSSLSCLGHVDSG